MTRLSSLYFSNVWKPVLDAIVSSSVPLFIGHEEVYTPATPANVTWDSVRVWQTHQLVLIIAPRREPGGEGNAFDFVRVWRWVYLSAANFTY